MKQTKILILILTIFTALTACAHGEDTPDPVIPESDYTSPVTEASPSSLPDSIPPDVPTEDDSQPPREGMVRSRLTNEWIEEEAYFLGQLNYPEVQNSEKDNQSSFLCILRVPFPLSY